MNFNTLKKTAISMALASAFIITAGVASKTFAQDERWRDRGDDGRYEERQENDGYHDGLYKGRDDARADRRFDPNCDKYFRDGSDIYREAFIHGYKEGFRQGRRFVDDYRAGRREFGESYYAGFDRGREDARNRLRYDSNCADHFHDGNGEYRESYREGYEDGFRQYTASRRY